MNREKIKDILKDYLKDSGNYVTTSTTVPYSTISTTSTYSVGGIETCNTIGNQIEDTINNFLESEDDLMPILKKYLIGCLDKVLEDPEPLIKDLIKEKDKKIIELEEKVKDLERQIDLISGLFSPYKPPILPNTNIPPYSPPYGPVWV